MPLGTLRHHLRRSVSSVVAILSPYRPPHIGQQFVLHEALQLPALNPIVTQTASLTQCHQLGRSTLAPSSSQDATLDLDISDAGDEALAAIHDYSPDDEEPVRSPTTAPSCPPTTSNYGQWASLSRDHARLREESTPPVPGLAAGRLIDSPEGEADIVLWACLLDFCQRTGFHDGSAYLLGELFRRRKLYQTDHPVSEQFWQAVVDLSIHDDRLMEDVLAHAVWMQDKRDTRWPQLYGSIMSSLMASREVKRGFRWHMLLSTFSAPSKPELIEVLKSGVLYADQDVKKLLQTIYVTSMHRGLYDSLVPFLWEQGLCGIALRWRHTFIRHKDYPRTRASRPFIRYFAAYFPQKPLVEQEVRAAGLLHNELSEGPTEEVNNDVNVLITLLGGKAPGTGDSTYNDVLGAKWFASSWISLETAIQFVHALGVSRIGPLSLQSIALREKSTADLVQRLKQLDSCGIQVGASRYERAIRHMATSGDWNTLQDLLGSDIHPDVFDDDAAQEKIRNMCAVSGDWKTYRMLAAVRVAEMLDGVTNEYNNYLANADLRLNQTATTILGQMNAGDIPLYASTSAYMSQFILDHMPHKNCFYPNSGASHFIDLSRMMLATPYPPPAQVWQGLLDLISIQLDFDQLEEISLEIISHYAEPRRDLRPNLRIPTADVPSTYHALQPDKPFQTLPRDLPLTNSSHPIAKIFDHHFQAELIRRAFKGALARRFKPKRLKFKSSASDYGIARGVKFLSELKVAGVNVPDSTVRKAVILCLVDLFSYDWVPRNQYMKKVKLDNRHTLDEARDLFNTAWGTALLPAGDELQQMIDIEGMARQKRHDSRVIKSEERNELSHSELRHERFVKIARVVAWLERMAR